MPKKKPVKRKRKIPQKRKSIFRNKWFYIAIVFLLFWFSPLRNTLLSNWDYFWYSVDSNKHPQRNYIPKSYKVIGVDISRYQKKYNWNENKLLNQNGDSVAIDFIIAKATEGTRLIDPMFQYNKNQATKHKDVIFGAYHFFLPDKDATTQANHFVNTIQLSEGCLVPVIDIEQRRGVSNAVLRERLKLFCNLLENKYSKKPIIYSNKHFLINNIGEGFNEYPIWVAHYQEKDINMPSGWNWKIWQFTDQGSAFGTSHKIDVNVFNGSKSELKELCIE